jgi:uncharacterized delta-60 repeat protein
MQWRLPRCLGQIGAAGVVVAVAALVIAGSSPGGRETRETFGRNGWIVTAIGRDASAAAVEIGGDGKIFTVGSSGGDFALARYQSDGQLDVSFAKAGKARLDFERTDGALAVAFQHSMTLVGGSACTRYEGIATADSDGPCAFALARYTSDGRLDPRFGDAGKTLTPLGVTQFRITVLVPRPDGTIIAAGGGNAYATVIKNSRIVSPHILRVGGALVRYTAAGRLDPTFGDRGIARTPFFVLKNGVTVQRDGRILVAGFSSSWGPKSEKYNVLLAHYTADGRLDKTWGAAGIVNVAFDRRGGEGVAAAAFQRDGRVVLLGDSARGFLLTRYMKNGRPDRTFGRNGATTTVLTGPDGYADAGEIALGPDGAIVAVGTASWSFALARYDRDGTLDMTFGARGKTITTTGRNDVEAGAVALQPDGKIVAAGDLQGNNRTSFTLARLTLDGRLDTHR